MKTVLLNTALSALVFFLTGCSKSPEEPLSSANQAQENSSISLTDSSINKNNCVGWQKSLAMGKSDKISDVENCLKKLALNNREESQRQAIVLQKWKIKEDNETSLSTLINVLAKFKSDAELIEYLNRLKLLSGKGAYGDYDQTPALTVDSFLLSYGRVYWFDVETGMFPNEHHFLLHAIARLSPDFKGVKFVEIAPKDYNDDKTPYQLSASLKRKSYQQTAENFGDWYDLSAVITLLNTMAKASESKDRFVSLPTGDQTAIVMVIEKKSLQTLIDDGLMIISDHNQAMLLGKMFEDKLLKAK